MKMKKSITLIGSLFILFVWIATVGAGEIRIVKVTASSIETNHPDLIPQNAIDGNLSTRWSANWVDPQWICFDLGAKQSFNQVTINWEAAYAKKYSVQISYDQKQWETVYSEENGNGGEDSVPFENKKARFVRILCTGRGTDYGYSIFEAHIMQSDIKPAASTVSSAATSDENLDSLPGNDLKVEKVVVSSIENDRPEFVKLFARDCSSEEDAHGSGVLSGTIETMPSFT